MKFEIKKVIFGDNHIVEVKTDMTQENKLLNMFNMTTCDGIPASLTFFADEKKHDEIINIIKNESDRDVVKYCIIEIVTTAFSQNLLWSSKVITC